MILTTQNIYLILLHIFLIFFFFLEMHASQNLFKAAWKQN